MDELTRMERIDRLADRWLQDERLAGVPATQIWDMAAERIDEKDRLALERRLDREARERAEDFDADGMRLVEDYG